MSENFVFSMGNIESISGSTQSDKDYIQYLVETAERRSNEALKKIEAISNAEFVLDSSSLAQAEGHTVELRAMQEVIKRLKSWLANKSELLVVHESKIVTINKNYYAGSASLKTLYDWFNLRPPIYR
jgi:hypothetical protein